MPSLFAQPTRSGGSAFQAKDAIVASVLGRLRVEHPEAFKAVLMPCLHGPELKALADLGVPRHNVYAIERDPEVYRVLRDPPPEYTHLQGIRVPPRPMSATDAIDHAQLTLGRVNLAYFDFFGQPDGSHYRLLLKLFRLRMLAAGATLLLTFGRNRGNTFACLLNRRLRRMSPAAAYVACALRTTTQPMFLHTEDYPYTSEAGNGRLHYTMTEVVFP